MDFFNRPLMLKRPVYGPVYGPVERCRFLTYGGVLQQAI